MKITLYKKQHKQIENKQKYLEKEYLTTLPQEASLKSTSI